MDKLKTHKLKTWPDEFEAILTGRKNFEVRQNDRDFCEGDYLTLEEYDPDTKAYTGRVLARRITFIYHGGRFGIEKDYVVMSIQ